LLAKLLVGTLLPTVIALGGLGFLAQRVAQRTLEDELGRRLATAAAAVAMMVLPEQISELQPGDEDSLTYANIRRKLALARASLDVRRVAIVAADLTARGDSDGRLGLGAEAYELGADRAEIARARAGAAIASPLFTGHDGLPYKRGYAAIGGVAGSGDVAGFAVVEASADYLVALAAFRRWLVTASAITVAAVLVVIIFIAGRITGPVARLARFGLIGDALAEEVQRDGDALVVERANGVERFIQRFAGDEAAGEFLGDGVLSDESGKPRLVG